MDANEMQPQFEAMKRILKDIVRLRTRDSRDEDDWQLGPQEVSYLENCMRRFNRPAGEPGSVMNLQDATVARLGYLFLRAKNEIDALEWDEREHE